MCGAGSQTKKGLEQLLWVLDEKSRAMLWHLWWHRHAEISELRRLINANNDFEVLCRLNGVINQQAKRLWGRPAVSFQQSGIDLLSGQKVLFSWWFLDGENVTVSEETKPLVDVFADKDGLSITAQVPTWVDPSHHELRYRNGVLKLTLHKTCDNVAEKETGRRESRR